MKAECIIEGCTRPHEARGWCNRHYLSWYKKGDPLAAEERPARSLSERFWSRVDQSGGPDACWTWTAGGDQSGYGLVSVDGRNQRTHRVSWVLHHGAIPLGLLVLHYCDNPPCVNPAHLHLGDTAQNMREMSERRRGAGMAATHCSNGHEYTEATTRRQGPRGTQRVCRVCERERMRDQRRKARA